MLNRRGPSNAEDLVEVVAENIRALRGDRGMSLNELAAAAGVGKSTLSMLESGNANPSIETLWAIAAALGVPLSRLIEPHEPDVRVVRAGEGVRIDSAEHSLAAELLVSSPRRGAFEIYSFEMEPGGVREASAHTKGAVEHLLVVAGKLRAGPAGALVELGPGDLASFPADRPHSYEALRKRTRAVMIMEYT